LNTIVILNVWSALKSNVEPPMRLAASWPVGSFLVTCLRYSGSISQCPRSWLSGDEPARTAK